jgi:hypothetical protein
MGSTLRTGPDTVCVVERAETPADAKRIIDWITADVPVTRVEGTMPDTFTTPMVLRIEPASYRLYEVSNNGQLGLLVFWLIVGGQRDD